MRGQGTTRMKSINSRREKERLFFEKKQEKTGILHKNNLTRT